MKNKIVKHQRYLNVIGGITIVSEINQNPDKSGLYECKETIVMTVKLTMDQVNAKKEGIKV